MFIYVIVKDYVVPFHITHVKHNPALLTFTGPCIYNIFAQYN